MTVYTCECCNFTTNNKTKYKRHLDTKKHQYMFKSYEKTKSEEEERTCKYCMKCFKYKQGLYRHMKYYCKKNDDEDLKELVRLMNEQLAQKSKELEEEKNKYFKEKERNSKMIKKLADKLQINLVVNNHIRLLNYKDTDLSHLTTTDYIKAINCVNYAIPSMVKMIHFNPNKPENMNIYIPNIKDKYVVLFKENTWQIQPRNKGVENLMDDKYNILREWYDENMREVSEEQYERLKSNFERFDANIENENVRKNIMNEITMFLYNQRNLIIKNSEDCNIMLLKE
mgnify:CR=1 FL=1